MENKGQLVAIVEMDRDGKEDMLVDVMNFRYGIYNYMEDKNYKPVALGSMFFKKGKSIIYGIYLGNVSDDKDIRKTYKPSLDEYNNLLVRGK